MSRYKQSRRINQPVVLVPLNSQKDTYNFLSTKSTQELEEKRQLELKSLKDQMALDKKEFEEKLNAVNEELKAYKLETVELKENLRALREEQDVTTDVLTFAIADLVAILKVDTSASQVLVMVNIRAMLERARAYIAIILAWVKGFHPAKTRDSTFREKVQQMGSLLQSRVTALRQLLENHLAVNADSDLRLLCNDPDALELLVDIDGPDQKLGNQYAHSDNMLQESHMKTIISEHVRVNKPTASESSYLKILPVAARNLPALS